MKARLIVADDHEVVRQGLHDIVSATTDLEIVGEAADGAAAGRLARTLAADLLILDIALPVRRGIAVLEALRADGLALPVLFFSMYPASQYTEFVRRAGAQGFVGKDADSCTLVRAVRQILAGQTHFAPDSPHAASGSDEADPFAGLSPREMEVMMGLLDGASLEQIAKSLQVGTKSVSTYRSRLLIKLGVTSNVELAAMALRNGYL
jgi:DNA-binding NarL/FixJ family response regulator